MAPAMITPPRAGRTLLRKSAGGPHFINRAAISGTKKEDLLFLTLQLRPCGKKAVVITDEEEQAATARPPVTPP